MTLHVRQIKEADDALRAEIAAVLAASFVTYRPWKGVWSDDLDLSCRVFGNALAHGFDNGWEVWVCGDDSDEILGAALWLPPGVDEGTEFLEQSIPLMPPHLAAHAITDVLPEFERVSTIVPGSKRAWWFLSFVGTLPSAQGRGVGGALLDAKMGGEAGPFALSTGSEKNRAWYARRGFRGRGSVSAVMYGGGVWEEVYMTCPGGAAAPGEEREAEGKKGEK